MKIITPVAISDAAYSGGNLAESDHALYSPATTYARGDYCISTAMHTIYRSLEDTNLNNDPDLEQVALADPLIDNPVPIQWQIISSTNKWKPFDEKPSHLCENADSIQIEITAGEFFQGIAMFAVDAITVEITMTDPVEGVVYSTIVDMFDTSVVVDWFTYYFAPFSRTTEFALTDLPQFASAVIAIEILKTGETARVGQIVLGRTTDFGFSQFDGSGFSGLDFSSVANDAFGNLETIKREATRLSDYSVVVDSVRLQEIDSKLRDLRGGSPAVWIGGPDPLKASLNYGFYRGYRVDYASIKKSIISIQVQGTV